MRDSTAKKPVPKSRNALFVTLATLAVLGVSFFGWVYKAKTRRELSIQLLGAVRNNDTEAVKSLLVRGADPNSSESMEKQQSVWQQLAHAARHNDPSDFAKPTLAVSSSWASVDLPPDKHDYTALETAVFLDSENVDIIEALLKAGAGVEGSTDDHRTPLMHAVRQGRLKTVQALLAHGANPLARDARGRLPVHHIGSIGNSIAIIDLLLKQGNEVDAIDNENRTPLMSHRIYARSNVTTLQYLVAKGANVNARSKGGGSALLMATMNHNTEAIQLLLEHGAQVNVYDKNKNTALGEALRSENIANVELLLAHGADINATISGGETPLTSCLQRDDPALLKILLANRPDVNHRNNAGDTALSLAKKGHFTECIRLLEAAGAKR